MVSNSQKKKKPNGQYLTIGLQIRLLQRKMRAKKCPKMPSKPAGHLCFQISFDPDESRQCSFKFTANNILRLIQPPFLA